MSSSDFLRTRRTREGVLQRHVERSTNSFRDSRRQQIDQFKQWYQGNNDLEKVCANDPAAHLARYADIAVNPPDLAENSAAFSRGLYRSRCWALHHCAPRSVTSTITIKPLCRPTRAGKCPFCGINDLCWANTTASARPTTITCPRRCTRSTPSTSAIAFTQRDPARLFRRLPSHCNSICYKTSKLQFAIEQRYKAKCCGDYDGKYWLMQILDEWRADNRPPADYLTTLARQASRYPFAECNFLKKAFLDGCERIGLFVTKT
jgi:hypothetical protein